MMKKVKEYVKKYHMITPGDIVVTGVSGGADSVCLLLMLQKLQTEIPFRIVIVHVNHGIREDAANDAVYVQQLAHDANIPFYLIEKDVEAYAAQHHLTVEEAGRMIRYEAFESVLRKESKGSGGKIAVAHNQNDRAETMLFHLFRGAGLNGLGSIKPVRDNIIRPILCLSREEIEMYLTEQGIQYCIDSTNAEEIYTRNKIRHRILPVAESVCEGATGHMAEAAETLSEAYDYIKKSAKQFVDMSVIIKDGQVTVPVRVFLQKHAVLQKEIIYQCPMKVTQSGYNITGTHIRDIYTLFCQDGNRKITLPGGVYAKREYETVIFAKASDEKQEMMQTLCMDVTGECDVDVPGLGLVEFRIFPYEKSEFIPEKSYTKWFDYDKIVKSLVLRIRQTGDYLTINAALSKKSLKNYMIQEKIPKDIRNQVYLLADGNHILWVIGHRISQHYKVDAQTKTILQVHVKRKESASWQNE
ncbi:MAG: tRNA lysidine(34) synthetase TilS [Lachnospiraceae bacterium]|nr:tRNA lysidine(34) synthetase TilS [Lachnospiraceae bacterium]